MENGFEVDYSVFVVSGVTCSICGLKFVVRLNYDYLAAHRGEELKVICCSLLRNK